MTDSRQRDRAFEAYRRWEREWHKRGRDLAGRTKTGQIRGLKGLIGEWSEQPKVRGGLREAMIAVRWAEIVGEDLARQAEPGRLDRGTLFVAVPDSAWRHQLLYMRRQLIGRINAAVGEGTVKTIRFTA